MSVPSNLIPTRVTQLPVAPVADENSLMMIVYQGNNYQIRVGDLLSVAGVPITRQVIAGTGMTGGGQLSSNVTLSIAPGGVGSTELASSGVTPGVYGTATDIPVFTVDATGRVMAATTVPATISGYVPDTRQVIAGTGLTGGGALSSNVTLAANLSNATPQLGDNAGSPGVSTEIARADHVHPAVDLSDQAQINGILPLDQGGTSRSIVPDEGAIIWCGADGLYVGPVGAVGQVMLSQGVGEYVWVDQDTLDVGQSDNLNGGTANQIAYQTAPDTTGFVVAPTVTDTFLKWDGATFTWQSIAGAGTVTSVDASGGTTGMSFSGGPITAAGTLTMSGTLITSNGGTGLTTYSAGDLLYYSAGDTLTKLTIGSSTYVLTSSGTAPQWSDPSGLTVGSAASATTATNLAGGTANQIPYQTGAGATSFLTAPTTADRFLKWTGSAFTWDVAGAGTVTSVDVSGGTTGLTTSGGPITTSGTITIAGTLAVANGGTGATTAPDARANLSAAVSGTNNDITSMTSITGGISSPDFIQFDAAVSPLPANATAKLYYNNDDQFQTLSFQMNGSVIQKIGEEQYFRVKCSSGVTKGQVVMFTGTLGASGSLTAAPATGLTAEQSNYLLGIAAETGATNDWIFVTYFGEVKGIDTTGGAEAWANGTVLYYNPAVTGGLTKNKPTTPNAIAIMAAVVYAHASNGILFIRPTYGSVLGGTDGNVQFGTLNNGDVIVYDGTDQRWENVAQSALAAGTATTATNVAGGAAGSLVYQSGAATTTTLAIGASTYILTSSGSAPQWSAPSGITVGSATSATTATNLAGGIASQIPYQTGAGATSFIANGTAGQVLLSAGTAAPAWGGIDGGTF